MITALAINFFILTAHLNMSMISKRNADEFADDTNTPYKKAKACQESRPQSILICCLEHNTAHGTFSYTGKDLYNNSERFVEDISPSLPLLTPFSPKRVRWLNDNLLYIHGRWDGGKPNALLGDLSSQKIFRTYRKAWESHRILAWRMSCACSRQSSTLTSG